MKKIVILFLCCFCTSYIFAQTTNDTLKTLLTGKTKYEAIEATVLNFYSSRFKGKGSGYNQWLRWLYFNRDRVTAEGDITNTYVKTSEALSNMPTSNLTKNIESMSTWNSLGPTSYTSLTTDYLHGLGRIDRIAFHPTNANIFYVGTASGGLWRTNNGGTNWACITEELPTPSIAGIVCSYNDPNTLYVLTGEGEGSYGYFNYMEAGNSTGVYKSTNAGLTWTKTAPLFTDNQYVAFQLIQHPTKPNVLYAATDKGLYCTINGGDSWVRSTTDQIRDIVFHPQRPEFIYADAVDELKLFFCTNDTTITSINVSGGLNSGSFVAMAVSPAQPNTVMLMTSKGNASGDDFKGLNKGTFTYNAFNPSTSTLSFSNVIFTPNILGGAVNGSSAGGQAWYNMCIALKPSDANTLITGGLCVWRSTAQGASMTAITKYSNLQSDAIAYIHPDIHRVAFNPLNDNLYALTDGGIYKSTNDGTSWTDITAGMSITQYYNIAGAESNANLILGGTQDNGTFFRNTNSANFKRVRGADGFSSAINPDNTNIIYWTENESLFKSINGGNNVSSIKVFPTTSYNSGVFPKVKLNLDYPDTLTAFTKSIVVLSKNAGANWDTIRNIGARDFSFCGDNNSKAYIVTGGSSLQVCTNIFAATPSWISKPTLSTGTLYTTLVTFPTYSDWVWLASGSYLATNKVIFSQNGGTTWTNLTGSLPNLPINCMAVDLSATLYIGTDVGVFIRRIGDSDWSPFSNGLPRVPVTEIVINNTAQLIRISTLGRGVWSSNIVNVSNCNFTESIAGSYYGQYYFQASNNIVSTGIIVGSAGTQVDLKAGSYISLNPGFIATTGAVVTAVISPCYSGIPDLSKQNINLGTLPKKKIDTVDKVKPTSTEAEKPIQLKKTEEEDD
jgi:hypothetical protein